MKTLFVLLFLSASLFGDVKSYIGLNYGKTSENYSTINQKVSSNFLNLKLGYGERKTYSIEIYLEYIKNESKVFSTNPDIDFDGDKYSLHVELSKSFDLNLFVLPFIKAGFGAGYLNIDRADQEKLSFGSFNLGTGLLIPVNEDFDFELAYRYRTYSYQEITQTTTIHKSKSDSIYYGLNYRF